MSLPRATLAALSRLYLAEAERGAWNGSENRHDPHGNDQVAHLRTLAQQADRATYLYQRAASADEIRELLTLKGRPGLGILIGSLQPSENPAALCEMFANNVLNGSGTSGNGFFEKGGSTDATSRVKIVAALRWAAQAYRRAHRTDANKNA